MAFIPNPPATTAPIMNGTAAVGVSESFARADHVHPSDTSLAPIANPIFTGTTTTPKLVVSTAIAFGGAMPSGATGGVYFLAQSSTNFYNTNNSGNCNLYLANTGDITIYNNNARGGLAVPGPGSFGGAVTLSSTLGVTGAITGTALTLTGLLAGASQTLSSTLTVTGAATFNGGATATTLTATGAATLANVTASGTLGVTGNITGTTQTLTGLLTAASQTLSGTLTVTGAATFNGTVAVPTLAAGTNTTGAASTAFVHTAIAAIPAGSSGFNGTLQTSGTSATIPASSNFYVVRNGTAAATALTLPASPVQWQPYTIKDGAGNANTYPITITPSSGTIDGAASVVINTAYQSITVMYDGTVWNIV